MVINMTPQTNLLIENRQLDFITSQCSMYKGIYAPDQKISKLDEQEIVHKSGG